MGGSQNTWRFVRVSVHSGRWACVHTLSPVYSSVGAGRRECVRICRSLCVHVQGWVCDPSCGKKCGCAHGACEYLGMSGRQSTCEGTDADRAHLSRGLWGLL